MFRNAFQSGFLTVLYSCGSSPLELWDMHVKNGYIRRVTDEEVKSLALEIAGTNVATTYIFCPADPKKVLAIKLPFLIMIVKNMKKYFTFEITILDDKNMHRRFRVSNFQSTTRVRPFCTSMPIGLSDGWNQIQFNLADFTRRAYGTNYLETTRMQIHANCRIRRIYFADRLYAENELPEEYKLFLPIHRRKCVREGKREPEKLRVEITATPPEFEGERPPEEEEEVEEPVREVARTSSMEAPAPSEVAHGETEEEEEEELQEVMDEALDEAAEIDYEDTAGDIVEEDEEAQDEAQDAAPIIEPDEEEQDVEQSEEEG